MNSSSKALQSIESTFNDEHEAHVVQIQVY